MEYGKIIEIEEVHGIKLSEKDWQSYEGYRVQTDKTKVLVLVSSGQDCCESFGTLSSFEDPKEFIGAEVISVDRVDTEYKKYAELEYGVDQGDTIFINFETTKGTFQLAVYNQHNGYYGHDAKVLIGDTVTIDEGL